MFQVVRRTFAACDWPQFVITEDKVCVCVETKSTTYEATQVAQKVFLLFDEDEIKSIQKSSS
jgi:hypothetical protein